MPHFNAEALMGPCVLLIWLSFILYGLVLVQVYCYFATYRDHLSIRVVVISLFALETLHMALCIHALYTYLILNFSNPEMLLKVVWSAAYSIYLEVIIGNIVLLNYVYRIWGLGKNIPVIVYLVVVICTRIAFELRSVAFLLMEGSWKSLAASSSFKRINSTALAFGVLADLSVTTAFVLTLYRNRSLAFTRGTKSILRRLMHHAVGSGILTSILQVTSLSLFVVGQIVILGGTLTLLSRVYVNEMLSMLNRRQAIMQDASFEQDFSVHLSNLPRENTGLNHSMTQIRAQVTRDIVTANDS